MKKILQAILAVVIVIVGLNYVDARLTGTDPATDIFCVGPAGAEICVDSSGNLISTTDSDATIGTSSLRFLNGFFDTIDVGTTLTIPDGSITTAKLAADAVTTAKLLGSSPGGALCDLGTGALGTCSNADASVCDCT